jgi:hypothetical protein
VRRRSLAYRDFASRASEARLLAVKAANAETPSIAAALAKGATVLTAAALERYVNDFLSERCKRIDSSTWAELSEGEQRYLAHQMAVHVQGKARPLVSKRRRDLSEPKRSNFTKALEDALAALKKPRLWSRHRDYGLFMTGAAETRKLDSALSPYLASGERIFDRIAARGVDRKALTTALEGLIDARHRVAHAVSGPPISPRDIVVWLSLARVLVRQIEAIIWK